MNHKNKKTELWKRLTLIQSLQKKKNFSKLDLDVIMEAVWAAYFHTDSRERERESDQWWGADRILRMCVNEERIVLLVFIGLTWNVMRGKRKKKTERNFSRKLTTCSRKYWVFLCVGTGGLWNADVGNKMWSCPMVEIHLAEGTRGGNWDALPCCAHVVRFSLGIIWAWLTTGLGFESFVGPSKLRKQPFK